jgi:hypothetical protein
MLMLLRFGTISALVHLATLVVLAVSRPPTPGRTMTLTVEIRNARPAPGTLHVAAAAPAPAPVVAPQPIAPAPVEAKPGDPAAAPVAAAVSPGSAATASGTVPARASHKSGASRDRGDGASGAGQHASGGSLAATDGTGSSSSPRGSGAGGDLLGAPSGAASGGKAGAMMTLASLMPSAFGLGDSSVPTNNGGGGGGGGGAAPLAPAPKPAATPAPQTPQPAAAVPDAGVSGPDMGCYLCSGQCTDVTSDVAHCGSCDKVCKPKQKCTAGVCTGGTDRQFVLDLVQFPKVVTDFSIDLNGDGIPDNKFVHFVASVQQYGFNLATNLEASVLGGFIVFLMDVPPPGERGTPAAMFNGLPTGMPDFSGMGTFLANVMEPAAVFPGARQSGAYEFFATPGTPLPVFKVAISAFNSKAKLEIPFRCVHMRLEVVDDTHIQGQIQGAVKHSDLADSFNCQVAHMLDDEINHDPNLPTALKTDIIQLWDNGGANGQACISTDNKTNVPDGKPGDGHIAPCEMLADPGWTSAFATDLQLFGPKDVYLPQSKTGDADSLSFGLAFTAVPAKFGN